MSVIDIVTLGDFKILIGGEDVLSIIKQSPQKTRLLEYLIVNMNRATTKADLVDVLWESSEELNLDNALKTLVSRLRKDLKDCGLKNAILTKQGAYHWNTDLDFNLDITLLEDLCSQLLIEGRLTKEIKQNFEQVLLLYAGDLLENSGLEAWISSKVYFYHNLYFKTIYHYIKLLTTEKDYGQIVRVCKTALEIDIFDTTINLELMKALMVMGKRKEALTQYQTISELYNIHLGTKPDDNIIDFYKHFLRGEHNPESSIGEISKELGSLQEIKGALVCEYSLFKDIYWLYMRNLKRLGIRMFLAVVSIKTMSVQGADPLEIDKVMTSLRTLLQDKLRAGDTISRYSLNQFAILLPSIQNHENGRMVMRRMRGSFYENTNHTNFKFDFRIMEIRANDDTEEE